MLLNTGLLHLSDFITYQVMFSNVEALQPQSGPVPACVYVSVPTRPVDWFLVPFYFITLMSPVAPGIFLFTQLFYTWMPCKQAPAAAILSESELQK